MLRPGSFERTITRDMSSGVTRSVMFDDYGVSRLESNGIEIASSRHHEFSIDEEDPLSARAEIQWSIEIGRGEWRTRSVVRVVQTATRDAFHIHAEMDLARITRRRAVFVCITDQQFGIEEKPGGNRQKPRKKPKRN